MNITMSSPTLIMHFTDARVAICNFFTIFNRTFHVIIITLIVSGCGSNRAVPAPDWDLAERVETTPAQDPIELIALCEIPWTETVCWERLDVYEEIAEGNSEIATLNASALRKTEEAYDELQGAGKLQQHLTDFYIDLLERERKDHKYDNWFHKSVIALGLLGSAL